MTMYLEKLIIELKLQLGEDKIDEVKHAKQPTIYVSQDQMYKAMSFLKQKFNFLSDLTAAEYEEHFEAIYHLTALDDYSELRVKVKFSKQKLQVPSLVGLWSAANVQEREAYDMFGIVFEGHPNLKSILLPDDFQGHPLSKDFKLDLEAR